MAIVVEDGTGVSGANSFVSLADARTYAADRGVTLSEDDAALSPLLHKAMDYLESKGLGLLSLSFPTENGYVCRLTDAQALTRLANAQAQLCVEQAAGVDLAPTRTEGFITEDTTGPLTTKYSEKLGGGPGVAPSMPAVYGLIKPLLQCGQGGSFVTLRV